MTVKYFILLICLIRSGLCNFDLTKNLRYFETIHKSQLSHHIVKRGVTLSTHKYNQIKEVEFKTLGKDFKLILSPTKGLLSSKFRAVEVDDEDEKEVFIPVDKDSFYDGRVFGENDSKAQVHMEDGVITANIKTKEDIYHIEPAWRHLPESDQETMIAYKESDIKFSWEEPDEHNFIPPKVCDYIKENGTAEMEEEDEDTDNSRHKRSSEFNFNPGEGNLRQTRCPLLLVADYRFYKEMGGSNSKTTVNYLISLIDRVHKIYEDTVWRDTMDSGGFSGMGFIIKKIVVHRKPTTVREGEVHYNMFRSSWDVRNLLEVFSREYTHKDFCLAHLFTDIKFEGGILGLAYVGSPRRNSVGGICTPEYFKNGYTLYLNSGLSSSRNHYGQRVITREADLVTAHEFGHNWGSEHDPDIPECSPRARQGGSYLMYTYSVSGYDVNNKKFSPCSQKSIKKVLQAKSSQCFTEPEESFCGNLKVEGDEECDAGLLGSEDRDNCCDENCKLRDNAVCSDKNSPCCDTCQYTSPGVTCRTADVATCQQEATCTGFTATCPTSDSMVDGTACVDKGTCKAGKCLPFCETRGLYTCMCEGEDACHRCCRPSFNSTCSAAQPVDILTDGTPCYQGLCNKGTCEKTQQDLIRTWDIIDEISFSLVSKIFRDNLVMIIVLLSLLIWIPLSCLVSWMDTKRMEMEEEEWEWRRQGGLVHPRDQRQVVHIRVPRPGENSSRPNRNVVQRRAAT